MKIKEILLNLGFILMSFSLVFGLNGILESITDFSSYGTENRESKESIYLIFFIVGFYFNIKINKELQKYNKNNNLKQF